MADTTRARVPARPGSSSPGGKKIGGIPVIYLVVGGVAVVGGYLWIRHQQAQAGQGSGSSSPGPARRVAVTGGGGGQYRFTEIIRDWQGHRRRVNPGGPRR